MEQKIFTVTENLPLTAAVYRMRLRGDTTDLQCPGRFVNLRIDGLYLRRPLSVCDAEGDCLTLIYKTVGEGTERMSRMAPGTRLDLLTGLGNGYTTEKSGPTPCLVGGGVGVPPLYLLCRRLRAEGKRPTVVLGFGRADEVFYAQEFRTLGAEVVVTTADGSCGIRGFVTAALEGRTFSYIYACGPEPMLHAVYEQTACGGQYSFEERMGCGFGACMGCTCRTKYGNKRICRDGPVLEKEEIVW